MVVVKYFFMNKKGETGLISLNIHEAIKISENRKAINIAK